MGYKHMSHIYENPDLTFSEIKDIFIKASQGELTGTEKTDGQNMLVSYSVLEGKAKAARNNSMLSGVYHEKGVGKVRKHAPGGVDALGWAEKWADHPSKTVRDAFVEAFEIFETAARSLTPKEQEAVFGDGENYLIFYNCEVQDPRNMNTIRYDKKTLTIHRVGHLYVDLRDGKVNPDIDVTRHAMALQDSLRTMQKSLENKEFALQINAIRRLEAFTNKEALKTALRELEKVINKEGLSDSQTVGEYTILRLVSMIRAYIDLPEEREIMLIKKILGHKGLQINLIKKDLSPDEKNIVSQLYSDKSSLLNNAIKPLENVIHNFAVEMLRGLESAFVLNQEKEIQRLRDKVAKKRKEIETSEDQAKIDLLMRHFDKIKNIENISTAAEGFVFDYNGKTYKFTGNFAPINQILGIGKYGSRTSPAKQEGLIKEEEGRIIALLPGAFKPPQNGHLNMVKHYAKIADIVKIFVSTIDRKSDDGTVKIDASQSMAVWNIYIRDSGLSNVEVMRSPTASPVGAVYDFVSNKEGKPEWAQPGDKILLGASTKGGDESRFAGDVQRHAREGVEVLNPMDYIYRVENEETALHGSDFRNALAQNTDIAKFLPLEVIRAGSEKEIISILTSNSLQEKKILSMESLFLLVEDVLNEVETEKQRRYMCAMASAKASERPKGLSSKEASHMCQSEIKEEAESTEMSHEQMVDLVSKRSKEIFRTNTINTYLLDKTLEDLEIARPDILDFHDIVHLFYNLLSDRRAKNIFKNHLYSEYFDSLKETSSAGGAGAAVHGSPNPHQNDEHETLIREQE